MSVSIVLNNCKNSFCSEGLHVMHVTLMTLMTLVTLVTCSEIHALQCIENWRLEANMQMCRVGHWAAAPNEGKQEKRNPPNPPASSSPPPQPFFYPNNRPNNSRTGWQVYCHSREDTRRNVPTIFVSNDNFIQIFSIIRFLMHKHIYVWKRPYPGLNPLTPTDPSSSV